MHPDDTERDIRLVELLDQALSELRSGRTVETATWQALHPDLPADLPDLLDTLRALDTAAESWKLTPTAVTGPTCAPGEAGPAPADPLPAQIARYHVLELLGAGGMGSVYKAHDPDLERIVAVKVPHLHGATADRAMRKTRFLREARAAAAVRHPHVCPIHDVGEDSGVPFVVMSFVEGESLAQRLRREGRYEDPRQAVALVRQVADALGAVHAHGIIHRDLKPGNILLDAAGAAVLSDFGLARSDRAPDQLTVEGELLGTPAYMAPEQAAGQLDRVGPWTDIYSLGVVLYQALTGRLPFEGPTTLSVLHKIASETPPPPSQFRPDLPPSLEAVVQKAMARRPEDRYQSPQQLAKALDSWAGAGAPPSTALPAVEAAPPTAAAGQKTVELSGLPDGQSLKLSLPAGTKADVKVTMTEGRRRKGGARRWRMTVNIAVSVAAVLLSAGGIHLLLNSLRPERDDRVFTQVTNTIEPPPAKSLFKKALPPDDHEWAHTLNNQGVALLRKKDVEEAVVYFRKAIQLEPTFVQAHNNLGMALLARQDVKEAEVCFRNAIQLEPTFVQAHSNLGKALAEKKDVERAVAAFREAIRLDPRNAGNLNDLASVLKARGQYAEALACYKEALAIQRKALSEDHPDLATSLNSVGTVLKAMGKTAEARRYLEQAIAIRKKMSPGQNDRIRARASAYVTGLTAPTSGIGPQIAPLADFVAGSGRGEIVPASAP